MILEELYLKEFNRFKNSNIKEFLYKPKNRIQIILGQNGSGKSSLLSYIIPNINKIKNDFNNNGFYKAKYLLKNNEIELSYDKDSNKHSFLYNGEELNQAGLIKTQQALIEQYFNLNKDISNLLLGKLNFSNMNLENRKKWFMEILSKNDYNYALNIYSKIKERIKELKNYIKLLNSKLLKDETLLEKMNDKYIEELRNKKTFLNFLLERLIDIKKPYKDIDLDKLYNKIEIIVDKATEILYSKDSELLKNVDNELALIKAKIDILKNKKEDLTNKLVKFEENIDIFENNDITKILKEKSLLENKLEEIEKILRDFYVSLDKIEFIYQRYSNKKHYLNELVSELNDDYNKIRNLNKEDIKKEIEILKDELTKLKVEYSSIEKEIEIMEKDKDEKLECPKCGNIFNKYYNKEKYESLLNKRDEIKKKAKDKLELYKELNNDLNKIKEYNDKLNLFKTELEEIDIHLATYFKKITNDFKNISILNSLLDKVLIKLEIIKDKKDLERRYKEVNELLNKLKDSDNEKYLKEYKELKDEYKKTIEELNQLLKSEKLYSSLKNKKENLLNYVNNLNKFMEKKNEILVNEYYKEFNKVINDLIKDVKEEIFKIEDEYNYLLTVKNRYDENMKELKDYEERLKINNDILKAMGPDNGLIGKSLVKEVNIIIENINSILNKIWEYDIRILPFNLENNDLNFKFQLMVNNKDIIDDISLGSSGMREIIDLAFKITVMEYLDITDYPLILDEFGKTLDKNHRINAYNYIDEISDKYFKQIFLVNHFEDMFGRFNIADIIALDNNVYKLNNVNNVVEIKK